MGSLRAFVLVGLGLALSPPAASASPPPGAELAVTDLGWPASTTAAIVRREVTVLDAVNGKRIATVAAGTRATWTRIVATADACKAWLQLEPRGWACARELTPAAASDADPPESAMAATPMAATIDAPRWAHVKPPGGTAAYDSVDAITSRAPARQIGDRTYVVAKTNARSATVGGVRYTWTDQGFISADALAWYTPSPFAGLELAPTTVLDFAWAVSTRPGAGVAVRAGASPVAAQVRELSPRSRVKLGKELAGFVKIGEDEWIDVLDLRRPEKRRRPGGISASERWVDVDLDNQLVMLYEGDTPVFVTLASTGALEPDSVTPTGIYRIRFKDMKSRMQDPGGRDWNVADVPYALRFRRYYALHGTYWHDSFGSPRSHGCVNLSTSDAKRVFDWVLPAAPAGWTSVEAQGDGTPVRIRSLRDPDPVWKNFDGKPLAVRP